MRRCSHDVMLFPIVEIIEIRAYAFVQHGVGGVKFTPANTGSIVGLLCFVIRVQ